VFEFYGLSHILVASGPEGRQAGAARRRPVRKKPRGPRLGPRAARRGGFFRQARASYSRIWPPTPWQGLAGLALTAGPASGSCSRHAAQHGAPGGTWSERCLAQGPAGGQFSRAGKSPSARRRRVGSGGGVIDGKTRLRTSDPRRAEHGFVSGEQRARRRPRRSARIASVKQPRPIVARLAAGLSFRNTTARRGPRRRGSTGVSSRHPVPATFRGRAALRRVVRTARSCEIEPAG